MRLMIDNSLERISAVIFDLDGVVTDTARLHITAWKEMFDDFLQERARARGEVFHAFDPQDDYYRYVDGKPRYEGAESFLESRGIELPCGDPTDPPEAQTVCGLGNRKNRRFQELLSEHGPRVYEDAVTLLGLLHARDVKLALVTSSRNGRRVLANADLDIEFDAVIDGEDAAERGLTGKPAPDIFLAAADDLGVSPVDAAVLEDAQAGVRAAARGGFGLVIGVARKQPADALLDAGAHRAISGLDALWVRSELVETESDQPLPGFDALARLRQADVPPALFLDYDGTLTPIVDDPDRALLDEAMRDTLKRLAQRVTVAVVSGRDLPDVRDKVAIDGLWYAGSHGFDIAGPDDEHFEHPEGTRALEALEEAERRLRDAVGDTKGAMVERKRFAIALHYRNVRAEDADAVRRHGHEAAADLNTLKARDGKMIVELVPAADWDKGKALDWLMHRLELEPPDVIPVYLGDDTTDEDAFRQLREQGIGIRVGAEVVDTRARYLLSDVDSVRRFLDQLASILESTS